MLTIAAIVSAGHAILTWRAYRDEIREARRVVTVALLRFVSKELEDAPALDGKPTEMIRSTLSVCTRRARIGRRRR